MILIKQIRQEGNAVQIEKQSDKIPQEYQQN